MRAIDEHSSISGQALPGIARTAVFSALHHLKDSPPRLAEPFLARSSPVFVTIREDNGRLRGCVGTLSARCPTVVEETWRMAREAAFADSRFPPVTPGELDRLRFEVSVLRPLEDVEAPSSLDPQRFGVVVSTPDGRRGALLPQVDGVNTVAEQLTIARRKGGIGPTEPIRIQRFEVSRYSD